MLGNNKIGNELPRDSFELRSKSPAAYFRAFKNTLERQAEKDTFKKSEEIKAASKKNYTFDEICDLYPQTNLRDSGASEKKKNSFAKTYSKNSEAMRKIINDLLAKGNGHIPLYALSDTLKYYKKNPGLYEQILAVCNKQDNPSDVCYSLSSVLRECSKGKKNTELFLKASERGAKAEDFSFAINLGKKHEGLSLKDKEYLLELVIDENSGLEAKAANDLMYVSDDKNVAKKLISSLKEGRREFGSMWGSLHFQNSDTLKAFEKLLVIKGADEKSTYSTWEIESILKSCDNKLTYDDKKQSRKELKENYRLLDTLLESKTKNDDYLSASSISRIIKSVREEGCPKEENFLFCAASTRHSGDRMNFNDYDFYDLAPLNEKLETKEKKEFAIGLLGFEKRCYSGYQLKSIFNACFPDGVKDLKQMALFERLSAKKKENGEHFYNESDITMYLCELKNKELIDAKDANGEPLPGEIIRKIDKVDSDEAFEVRVNEDGHIYVEAKNPFAFLKVDKSKKTISFNYLSFENKIFTDPPLRPSKNIQALKDFNFEKEQEKIVKNIKISSFFDDENKTQDVKEILEENLEKFTTNIWDKKTDPKESVDKIVSALHKNPQRLPLLKLLASEEFAPELTLSEVGNILSKDKLDYGGLQMFLKILARQEKPSLLGTILETHSADATCLNKYAILRRKIAENTHWSIKNPLAERNMYDKADKLEKYLELFTTTPNDLLLKILQEYSKSGNNDPSSPNNFENIIRAAEELYQYKDAKSVNELSLSSKKSLMRSLVSQNILTFDLNLKELIPLLPNDQKEYCELLPKLAKAIGVEVKGLSKEEIKGFNQNIINLGETLLNTDIDKISIEQKISREEFVETVQKALVGLDNGEKLKIADYFGFGIENGKLLGYPQNLNNGKKLEEIEDPKTREVIENLRGDVKKYSSTKENPVVVNGSKELQKELNNILEALPEFRATIGKKQHETQKHSLDIHTLKVLQCVCKHPDFQKFNESDKRILSIAALLHDITKAEGQVDPLHPMESAFDAYFISRKLDLTESEQLKTYRLIKTHDWLAVLAHSEDAERTKQNIGFDLRHSNTFDMAKILCEADLKSVNDNFFKEYGPSLKLKGDEIDKMIWNLRTQQHIIPQTRIPKNNEILKNLEKYKGSLPKGVSIKNGTVAIELNKVEIDLSELGFQKGTTKENFKSLVHAVRDEKALQIFNSLSAVDSEALLSTSLFTKDDHRAYCNLECGVILNINYSDIQAGSTQNFGSGTTKNIQILKDKYLFSKQEIHERFFLPSLIKQYSSLTDEEYVKIAEKMQDCKSLEDIQELDPNFAKGLEEAFKEYAKAREGIYNNNEILVTRPVIQGVFLSEKEYAQNMGKLSYIENFAKEDDLPIIVFG